MQIKIHDYEDPIKRLYSCQPFYPLNPFSFITGWNIATALIYWVFMSPFMADYLPTVFRRNTFYSFREMRRGLARFKAGGRNCHVKNQA